MRSVALFATSIALINCSGGAETEPFNADANDDGFITKVEAESAFVRFEQNEIAPGLWSIAIESDFRTIPDDAKKTEYCVRASEWAMLRDDFFADRYDKMIRQLPSEKADIKEFKIDGTNHRIVIKSGEGEMTLSGHFAPESFESKISGPQGYLTYKGRRTGTCER